MAEILSNVPQPAPGPAPEPNEPGSDLTACEGYGDNNPGKALAVDISQLPAHEPDEAAFDGAGIA